MDQSVLVGHHIEDGKAFVERLTREGFEVAAAGWLKPADEEAWYLHVVTPLIDTEGTLKTYGRINDLMRQMPASFGLHPLDVKLISPKFSTGRRMIEVRRGAPTYFPWSELGAVEIEAGYIYPPAATTAAR